MIKKQFIVRRYSDVCNLLTTNCLKSSNNEPNWSNVAMDPKNPPPRISAAGLLGPDLVFVKYSLRPTARFSMPVCLPTFSFTPSALSMEATLALLSPPAASVSVEGTLKPSQRRMCSSSPTGGNCIKIGLPGKSILGDYFQENMTSQRPFLLLRISFPGRPIFIQFVPERSVFTASPCSAPRRFWPFTSMIRWPTHRRPSRPATESSLMTEMKTPSSVSS